MARQCMPAQGAQVAHSWVWPAAYASVAMERYITAFQHDSAMRTMAFMSFTGSTACKFMLSSR